MAQSAYLDSNCLAYAFGQPMLQGWTAKGIKRLRSAIAEAYREDRMVICGSQFHLEEASRINDTDPRSRFFEHFWETVKWYLFLPTYDLVKLEAKLRRPLESNEPYEEYGVRQTIRHGLNNRAAVNEIAVAVATRVQQWRRDNVEKRERALRRIQEAFANKTPAEVSNAWWLGADAHIEDWMNDYIQSSQQHLGLSDDPSSWPKPRDLQTAWAIHAYQMARIVMNVGLQQKIGDGDLHDAHHFATAWYADIFVTEDQAFRNTIAIIPNTPVTVMSFSEFARQLGVDVG